MAAPALGRLLVRDDPPATAGWAERALTHVGAFLDHAMLAGMRLAFAEVIEPATSAGIEESARPYLDADLQREPRRFFSFLDEPARRATVRTLDRRATPGGTIAVHELETCYAPWHASAAWPACPANARVPIEHWRHRAGDARAVVIALHGFTMGRPWIDSRILMAAQWFARGYDVVLPILPFHGTRAPSTARYSGEAFGSWDVRRLNEAVREAVHDIELVRRWISSETRAPIGLVGLSLGGYLAALLAGLQSDLAFAVPVAAPSSLAFLPQRLFHFGRTIAPRPPIGSVALDAAYRVHCPLTFPRAIPRERTFIVGGLGDGVVPPSQVEALWRHWGEPPIHWFTGGHTTPFGRARIMARIDQHLRTIV